MAKRFLAFIAALVFFLPVSAYTDNAVAALQDLYTQAELMMAIGDYSGAAAQFDALGTYSDSSQMAMYCKALVAAETLNLYDVAIEAFVKLGDFKDIIQMKEYYTARENQDIGDIYINQLETVLDKDLKIASLAYSKAIDIYSELALFKDCLTRLISCQDNKQAVDNEIKTRREKQLEEKYQKALALEEKGLYEEAIVLFSEIKDYKDSKKHIEVCKLAIEELRLAELEKIYQEALRLKDIGDYEKAIGLFQTIVDYKDAAEQIIICSNELHKNDIIDVSNYSDEIPKGKAIRGGYYLVSETRDKIIYAPLRDGLFSVKRGNKYGYIDADGNTVIPFEWDEAFDFSEGLAGVCKNDKWGYIDTTGSIVIPLEYERTGYFSEGMGYIKDKGKAGFIDITGSKEMFQQYSSLGAQFSCGLVSAGNSGGKGYIDKTGKIIVPFDYSLCTTFKDGIGSAYSAKAKKWIIFDTNGDITGEYSGQWPEGQNLNFHEGLAGVINNNKSGFIDHTGKVVIPGTYDELQVDGFHEGLAGVRIGSYWGYINKTGELVIPAQYDNVHAFTNGLAFVKKDNRWQIIDTWGNVLW